MATRDELAIALGVAFYLLQRFVLIPKLARKRLRQDPVFYNGIEVEIDERGFRVRSTKTQSDWLWTDLIGYRENTAVFLLYPSRNFGHVLPKRLFTAEELAALTALLESKLKRLWNF